MSTTNFDAVVAQNVPTGRFHAQLRVNYEEEASLDLGVSEFPGSTLGGTWTLTRTSAGHYHIEHDTIDAKETFAHLLGGAGLEYVISDGFNNGLTVLAFSTSASNPGKIDVSARAQATLTAAEWNGNVIVDWPIA